MRRLVLFALVALVLAGCTTTNIARKYAEMPEYVREQPSVVKQPIHHEGSLWTQTSENLFSDVKARHVGDIVTIVVQEQASSQYSSNLKAQTSSSMSAGLSTLLGFQNRILNRFKTLGGKNAGKNGILNTASNNQYQGSGENQVNNKLIATITARVVKVLPNHRLFIRGEKQVFTNGEENTLIITGIIDADQISNNDTIDSSYIADAKIFFNGKGIVSSTRNEGWLVKLWNIIKPF